VARVSLRPHRALGALPSPLWGGVGGGGSYGSKDPCLPHLSLERFEFAASAKFVHKQLLVRGYKAKATLTPTPLPTVHRLPFCHLSLPASVKQFAKRSISTVLIAASPMGHRYTWDEDDVTGFLVGSLHTEFDNGDLGGIELRASILRHRKGAAAEERRIGADILIHVSMETSTQSYSKGVLIQAKKSEATEYWSQRWRADLVDQCNKMLSVTASAFVFNYNKNGIRCGAATRVAGASGPTSLRYLCGWTSYRFFLELFRCPIGDPRITSARIDDLPVPFALQLSFSGDLDLAEGASL
jgi:hypothetical protein